tara:strand:+ start:4183 stop:5007 length:825 start_codon:yes stop_codon:yes gene_type:complete
VHGNLICAYSAYFKQKLQNNRKPVEGECAICHEDLDPTVDDITFCRAECGQNVHEDCMNDWKRSKNAATTCPMCRKRWKNQSEGLMTLDEDLDRSAVHLYVDWLYTGELQMEAEFSNDEESGYVGLLKAWTVSEVLDDSKFRSTIVAKYFQVTPRENFAGFWIQSAEYAFEEQESELMRSFVTDAFLANIASNWFELHAANFPESFVYAVGTAALRAIRKFSTRKEVLQRYTRDDYEVLEDSENEDEDMEDGEHHGDDDIRSNTAEEADTAPNY